MHNEFYEGNVGFAIRLRTFAASIVNGNLGSVPALRGWEGLALQIDRDKLTKKGGAEAIKALEEAAAQLKG